MQAVIQAVYLVAEVKKKIILMAMLFSMPTLAANVTLNQSIQHQTMHSWELVDFAVYADLPEYNVFGVVDNGDPFTGNYVAPGVVTDTQNAMGAQIAQMGINRIRLEAVTRYERGDFNPVFKQYMIGDIDRAAYKLTRHHSVNDNNDPHVINWAGFSFDEFDFKIDTSVVPIRNAMQANGDDLYVLLNYVDFADSPFDHLDPSTADEEYAEFILAHFIHMNNKYGFVPDGVEVKLEPDYLYIVSPEKLADVIVATALRLTANGFDGVEFIAPSTVTMDNVSSYFDAMISHNPAVLNHLTEIAYHTYAGNTLANRQAVASRAQTHQLRTAQLEYWNDAFHNLDFTVDHLTQANNSSYQFTSIMSASTNGNANSTLTPFVLDLSGHVVNKNWAYWYMRQFTAFITKGDIRINSSSDDAAVRPIGFIKPDGSFVLVLKTNQAKLIHITGLPAGEYGISYVTGHYQIQPTSGVDDQHQVHLTNQTISANDDLTVNMPSEGVMTVVGINSDLIFMNGYE